MEAMCKRYKINFEHEYDDTMNVNKLFLTKKKAGNTNSSNISIIVTSKFEKLIQKHLYIINCLNILLISKIFHIKLFQFKR